MMFVLCSGSGRPELISGSAAEGTQSLNLIPSLRVCADIVCFWASIAMCSPTSKEGQKWRVLCYLALATTMFAAFSCVQFLMAFGVQWQLSWIHGASEPFWIGGGRTKSYASQEVLDEVEGLQRYVATLAARDINGSTNVFAAAAFDLAAQDPADVAQGLIDWDAFLSPAQHHAHAMCHQHPLTWGHLESVAYNHLCHGAVANLPQTAPATIWLTARLPGSGKRASTAMRQADGGGDNGTEPSSGVGASSSSSGPLQPVAGANVSSDPTIVRSTSSLPTERLRKRPAASELQYSKWFQTYGRLRDWLQSHAGVYPRLQALTSDEKALAKFVDNNRQKYRQGQLSGHQQEQLALLSGWTWQAQDSTWVAKWTGLAEWLTAHGQTYPRQRSADLTEKDLGKWVDHQRQGRPRLTTERVAQLEALPRWTWHALDSTWDDQLADLGEWLAAHDQVYPRQRSADPAEKDLGQWVNKQRKSHSRLNAERVAQLEGLPRWTWNAVESTWDDNLAALDNWLAAHDQVYPRRQCDDAQERQLARWVGSQRQNRALLTAERQHSLEALPAWQWRASGIACCFLRLDSYTRCGADCHLQLAPNNLHYCRQHFKEVQGMPVRRARLLNDDLVVEDHPTKRKRLTFKQPPATRAQSRTACKWRAGCQRAARENLEGQWFCKIHASCICGEMAAVLSLADYKDAFVNTHTGSTLGDKCDSCGAYNFPEERTGTTEHFNICCQNGKVCCQQHNPKAMIKHCAPPPPELLDILTGRSAQKRQAREMLKKYNNAFSFVSYGEKCFHKIDGARGPPVTVCHGTVYHLSGILFPDDGELGKYAQVYLYDHNEAMDLRQRNHWNDGLDKHILEQLQIMMDRESPYVAMYR